MKNFNIGMLTLGMAFSAGVMAEETRSPMTPELYQGSEEQIKTQYKTDKEVCNSMSGNTKDICTAEAKGRQKVAKSELDAQRKDTEKARYNVVVTKAEAEYEVAKERCDDRSGNDKDVCHKEAKAAFVTAKTDAKTQLKTAQSMDKADDKAMDAREDSIEDRQAANYAAAKERCDSLAGTAKDNCVSEAKSRHGKL